MAGQYFKVEYSTDGSTWTNFGNQSSNSFTVTGLTAGTLYFFRFTLIKSLSPLVECDPVVKTFYLPDEQPCASVVGEIQQDGDIYELVLTFTLPSPYSDPCGGWRLDYGIAPNMTTIYFPSFIASPSINPMTLPAINATYTVKLYSIDCEGNATLCDELEVTPPIEPCAHADISDEEIVLINGQWFIKLMIVPSNPVSTTYSISYYQANTVTSGQPDPGGTVTVNVTGTNPEIFYIPISPNLFVPNGIISYAGGVVDRCGFTSRFDVSEQA